MNNNQPNVGSFMANAGGGGSAIARAMARRGMGGGGVVNQAGPGSPAGANSVLPVAPPSNPMNTAPAAQPSMPPPPMPGQGGGQPMPPQLQGAPMPQVNPVKEMIVKALSDQLDSMSKIEETQAGVQ